MAEQEEQGPLSTLGPSFGRVARSIELLHPLAPGPLARRSTRDAVEALGVIGRLQVRELVLARAGWRFYEGADVGPRV